MLNLTYEVIEDGGVWIGNSFKNYGDILQISEAAAKYFVISGSIRLVNSSNNPLPTLAGNPSDGVVYIQIMKDNKVGYIPLSLFVSKILSSVDPSTTPSKATSVAQLISLGHI